MTRAICSCSHNHWSSEASYVQVCNFTCLTLRIEPPTIKTFVAFFDITTRHTQISVEKIAPGLTTLSNGLELIKTDRIWRYPGWTFDLEANLKIKSLFDKLVEEGRVHRGTSKKRVRAPFVLAVRMTDAYFDHALRFGVRSFDLTVSNLSNTALMAAGAARAGDIGQYGYGLSCSDPSFLSREDVEVVL